MTQEEMTKEEKVIQEEMNISFEEVEGKLNTLRDIIIDGCKKSKPLIHKELFKQIENSFSYNELIYSVGMLVAKDIVNTLSRQKSPLEILFEAMKNAEK